MSSFEYFKIRIKLAELLDAGVLTATEWCVAVERLEDIANKECELNA